MLSEALLPYPFSAPPPSLSPEDFSHLRDRSPLKDAASVTAPTLLMIGSDDRRVPPDQGRAWYHALKGAGARSRGQDGKEGVDVEMLVFPGNGHQLSSTVETEVVQFEEGLRFLARHTVF